MCVCGSACVCTYMSHWVMVRYLPVTAVINRVCVSVCVEPRLAALSVINEAAFKTISKHQILQLVFSKDGSLRFSAAF